MKIKGLGKIWEKYRVQLVAALIGFGLVFVFGGAFAWNNFQKKASESEQKKEVKAAENSNGTPTTIVLDDSNDTKPSTNPGSNAATPSNSENQPQAIAPTVPGSTTTSAKKPTYNAPIRTYITPTSAYSAPAATSGTYTTGAACDYVEGQILALVNAERRSKGLGNLLYNSTLARGADIRVSEESILSFVGTDHTRPNGTSWSTILGQIGYSGYSAAGENLAWGYKPAFTLNTTNLNGLANQLFTQWKNSPGHYAQIINPKYNQTGIGVNVIIQNGRLYYYGEELFGAK